METAKPRSLSADLTLICRGERSVTNSLLYSSLPQDRRLGQVQRKYVNSEQCIPLNFPTKGAQVAETAKITFVRNTELFASRYACPDLLFLHRDQNPSSLCDFLGSWVQVPPGRDFHPSPAEGMGMRRGGSRRVLQCRSFGQNFWGGSGGKCSHGCLRWARPAPASAPPPQGCLSPTAGARRCHLPRAWERERPVIHISCTSFNGIN